MAKRYNYMKDAEYLVLSMGVRIRPYVGTVETVWKIPAKYRDIAEEYICTHYDNDMHPAIKIDSFEVSFNRNIDYSGLFDNLIEPCNRERLSEIMVRRNDAINDAVYQLILMKESFQDMIRGMYYTQRYIDNAPSIP